MASSSRNEDIWESKEAIYAIWAGDLSKPSENTHSDRQQTHSSAVDPFPGTDPVEPLGFGRVVLFIARSSVTFLSFSSFACWANLRSFQRPHEEIRKVRSMMRKRQDQGCYSHCSMMGAYADSLALRSASRSRRVSCHEGSPMLSGYGQPRIFRPIQV